MESSVISATRRFTKSSSIASSSSLPSSCPFVPSSLSSPPSDPPPRVFSTIPFGNNRAVVVPLDDTHGNPGSAFGDNTDSTLDGPSTDDPYRAATDAREDAPDRTATTVSTCNSISSTPYNTNENKSHRKDDPRLWLWALLNDRLVDGIDGLAHTTGNTVRVVDWVVWILFGDDRLGWWSDVALLLGSYPQFVLLSSSLLWTTRPCLAIMFPLCR